MRIIETDYKDILAVTQQGPMLIRGLFVSLITLWARHVFIPVASHGGFCKGFAKTCAGTTFFLIPALCSTGVPHRKGEGYAPLKPFECVAAQS